MSAFTALTDTTSPVRVVLVGAGGMGKRWLEVLSESPDVELVGLVDLNLDTAEAARANAGLPTLEIGSSLSAVVSATGAQAVVNVTIPIAHHPVNVEAMSAGLPVLCEKPVAPTVSQGLSLAATAEVTGQLLMISQSRRYYRTLAEYRDAVRGLGRVGILTTEFFKAPHFGGFREEMAHVLLVDMAIHAFDVARYVLDADPVSVYCEEFNPSWSWYSRDAAATAIFEFGDGTRYVYTGNWCADGLETSWNGTWRANGEHGTATWDGETSPVVDRVPDAPAENTVEADDSTATLEEIEGSLAEFVSALRTGIVPSGEVHSNVFSLAMVEAAVRSAETGERVRVSDVLEAAYLTAVADEARDDVRAALEGWGSARNGLGG
ncbi:Gfo/Idh/MocA family protein [Planctomonas psychrotolerans]|uniref:Gfo/Idh/MocA family protein n=1 Tax=Planctomonas psychrotolerans TaxID=2528712 RepID=UPI001D0D7290|nr:Gfo/Idh/MocA family oxidoreductase [Planctomonas psychrotolerans]